MDKKTVKIEFSGPHGHLIEHEFKKIMKFILSGVEDYFKIGTDTNDLISDTTSTKPYLSDEDYTYLRSIILSNLNDAKDSMLFVVDKIYKGDISVEN